MDGVERDGPIRSPASIATWSSLCKGCLARARSEAAHVQQRPPRHKEPAASTSAEFTYSDHWADQTLERGGSRSDRCPRCRQEHRKAIESLAVAYIDIQTIAEVDDRENPTGPLGGLGPLPVRHEKAAVPVELQGFTLGVSDSDINELLAGLVEKRVAVLEAGTGTGKSTFVPFRLMEPPPGAPLRLTEAGPIIVTQPRIPAATGIARFVGESFCFGHEPECGRHFGPGFPVGYQISGKKRWDDACQLIYVTDGTMINWIRDGRLARFSTVIVDEAHERSENIDLILALLRDELPRRPHLRVVIASATINKDFFVEYFGGAGRVFSQYIPPVKTVGYGIPLFPGEDIGPEEIAAGTDDGTGTGERFDGWPQYGTADGDAPPEDLHATTTTLLKLRATKEIPVEQMPGAVVEQILRICSGTTSGDILAFLPTSSLIDEVIGEVRKRLKSKRLKGRVLPFRREATDKDKASVQAPSGSIRKIIVATNLAETSLTISGVRYVVDSGLICETEWDPEIGQASYPTKPHSRSGVRQRWGRVGRDAPGWVFPLYTKAQFAALARDTAPGSTRANLEEFVVKLKSAGIDNPASLTLPGNFTHDNVARDAQGMFAASVFTRELQRAERALELNGATDAEGHLTQLGRELERFPGSSEAAMALMYADQLACVPEVAIALALLENGRLIGPKDYDLFRYNREWPPEWCVHAASCHRAFAVGAMDDLDVVLRTVASWEEASDPARWAAQWWVNSNRLAEAKQQALTLIEGLSPAMKREAIRPIDFHLVERARVAIGRALVSQRYAQSDSGWVATATTGGEALQLGREHLTEPASPVVALSRFRPPARNEQQAPTPAVIQGLVAVPDWVVTSAAATPFEMACEVARRLPSGDNVRSISEATAPLRQSWSIGSVVRVGAEPPHESLALSLVDHGFAFPGEAEDDAGSDVDAAGSDGPRSGATETLGDWGANPQDHIGPIEIPPEEAVSGILDIRELETTPDDSSDSPDALVVAKGIAGVDTERPMVVPANPAVPLPADHSYRAVVQGHDFLSMSPTSRSAAIVVNPCDDDVCGSTDPAAHPHLNYGDTFEVTVGPMRIAYASDFRVLDRVDGQGAFLLSDKARGLDAWLPDLGSRLSPESRWSAHVAPGFGGHERITATLLPALAHDLSQLPIVAKGGPSPNAPPWRAASIVGLRARKDGSLDAVVEIDSPDHAPVQHHFLRSSADLANDGMTAAVGLELEVQVGPDLIKWRQRLKADVEGLGRILDRSGQFLTYDPESDGRVVCARRGPVPLHVINELLRVDERVQWQRDVWQLWLDSLHQRIIAARPRQERVTIPLPAGHPVTLSSEKRRALSDRTGARISVVGAELTIEGTQSEVHEAQVVLTAAARFSSMVLELPDGTVGRVIGKGRTTLSALESTPGVVGLDVRGQELTVVADDGQTLRHMLDTIRGIVEQASAELLLPSASDLGRLIGKQGVIIKALQAETGCQARTERGSELVAVNGPSRAAVEKFATLAAAYVPGLKFRVTREHTIRIRDINGTLR